tara:strand:- start:154450 stop:154998 length:549 start_codon:yes stop_codon:yes gene_type:complete
MCDHSHRWRVAIHEAGHAIAALELGGETNGVILTAQSSGLALVDGLHGDCDAFMSAAGTAAEYLADQHTAPDEPITTPQQIAADDIPADSHRDFATACSFADLPTPRSSIPDDVRIARWAIAGRESDPDCWAGRVDFAKYVAEKIINANVDRIVAVASQLFIRGRLSGDEIQTIHTETKANV